MAEPYISEIRIFAFNFAPKDWALCNGAILPISQNQGLFALIGKAYGGDGVNTFALPDLRGRTPIHQGSLFGNAYSAGNKGGLENVTLDVATMPKHTHAWYLSTDIPISRNPSANLLTTDAPVFTAASNLVAMSENMTSSTGGGQAHNNMQPSLVLNFCIYINPDGTWPARN